MNIYLVFASGFAAATLIAIGLYFWDLSRGPIIWETSSPSSPIAWWRQGDGPLWFSAFQIKGINRWNDVVTPSNAYIKSNITGTIVPLTFNPLRPLTDGIIPPGAPFILVSTKGPWLNPQSNLTTDVIEQEFGSFTFVFESPQKNYSIRFDRSDVDALIALADGEKIEKPPAIIFKPDGK